MDLGAAGDARGEPAAIEPAEVVPSRGRRVAALAILGFLVASVVGLASVAGVLFVRPWLVSGVPRLDALAIAVGLGSAGMLSAGAAAWRARAVRPERLPRALSLGMGAAGLAAIPGLEWLTAIARGLVADALPKDLLAIALVGAVVTLPIAAGGLGCWARLLCGGAAQTWPRLASDARVPLRARLIPNGLALVSASAVVLALTYPGGPPAPRSTREVHGLTPHAWLEWALDGYALGIRGVAAAGADALPDLEAALDAESGPRWAAARWLDARSAEDAGGMHQLLRAKVRERPDQRVAKIVECLGKTASPLAPRMITAAFGDDPVSRWRGVFALREVVTSDDAALHKALLAGLSHPDLGRRVEHAWSCCWLSRDAALTERARRVAGEGLASPDARIRQHATSAMSVGPHDDALPTDLLLRILDCASPAEWRMGFFRLPRHESLDGALLTELRRRLAAGGPARARALELMSRASDPPPELWAAIQADLEAPDAAVRRAAAETAREAARSGPRLGPVLDRALDDSDSVVRCAAALAALRLFGRGDAPISVLRNALTETPRSGAAEYVLGAIRHRPTAVRALGAEVRACVQDSNQNIGRAAAIALLACREERAAAVTYLLDIVRRADRTGPTPVEFRMLSALAHDDGAAHAVRPILAARLTDSRWRAHGEVLYMMLEAAERHRTLSDYEMSGW